MQCLLVVVSEKANSYQLEYMIFLCWCNPIRLSQSIDENLRVSHDEVQKVRVVFLSALFVCFE